NLICDRAMLGAYASHREMVDKILIRQAAREVLGDPEPLWSRLKKWGWVARGGLIGLTAGMFLLALLFLLENKARLPEQGPAVAEQPTTQAIETVETAEVTEAVPGREDVLQNVPGNSIAGVAPTEPPVSVSPFRQMMLNLPEATQESAYRAVLRRWGVDYDYIQQMPICDDAELAGLRCLHSQGNWRSLLSLDRPAVLKLRNPVGQEFYVALLELENNLATINYGEQRLSVTLEELDTVWFGHYSVLWKLPPFPSALIRANGTQAEREWLSRRLDQIEAMQAVIKVDSDSYEAGAQRLVLSREASSLEERLRAFQLGVGLVPDGIAGSLTLIHMNSLLDSDVFRLQINHSGVQAGGTN